MPIIQENTPTDAVEDSLLEIKEEDFFEHRNARVWKEYTLYILFFIGTLSLFLLLWYVFPSFLSKDHTESMAYSDHTNPHSLSADMLHSVSPETENNKLLETVNIKAVYD